MGESGKEGRIGELEERVTALTARLDLQEGRLAAMRRIGRALSSTLDLDQVLSIVMDQVTDLMDAERSSLYLVDEARGELWTSIAQGENMEEIRLRIGEGVAGWVAGKGKTVNIVDAYQDDRFDPDFDKQTGFRTRSMLCMPVRDPAQKILGVVQVLNKRSGRFTVEDEELLEALVGQAAVSLENAQLYLEAVRKNIELTEARDELERRLAELDLLYELEQEVAQASDLGALLDRILAKAMNTVGAEAGSVLLREGESGHLYFKAALGAKGEAVKQFRLPLGKGVAGFVAQSGEPRMANDLEQEQLFASDIASEIEFPTRNLLCVPLGEREEPTGAMELLNKTGSGRRFDEGDLRLLTLIAGQATRAIELEQGAEEARRADRLSDIGRMLAGVMHDFKTPMTVISGYTQMLARLGDEMTRDEYAATIVRQVDVMNHMIRELLAFARGETEVLVHRVHLDRFFSEVEKLLAPQFGERGIVLGVRLDYDGTARLDEEKLRRMVQNIARNAYDAMPDGGSFVIRVGYDEERDRVVITFADTGPGIPAEFRDTVFESFATHGKRGGTGLGLAIAKKFAEDHGGEIGFETEVGKGTTFRVELPRNEETG